MNKWKKFLLCVICFFIVVVSLLFSFDIWRFRTKTVLFSDDTLNGQKVQVIQKGHQFLTGKHCILITVDDEEICEFILIPARKTETTSMFSSQYVFCEVDNETSYKIVFDTGRQVTDHFIEFNADFTKIKCNGIWEYKHMSDKVELVELVEWQ